MNDLESHTFPPKSVEVTGEKVRSVVWTCVDLSSATRIFQFLVVRERVEEVRGGKRGVEGREKGREVREKG